MQSLWHDLRYALRLIRRRPALTAISVVTLAIGIGGTTATFSVLDALLLRPLPVADPRSLVRVFGATDTREFDVLSYPNAVDLGTMSNALASLAIHQQTFAASGLGDDTKTAAVELVSGNYFSTLGVPAAFGRAIQRADDPLDAGEQVAVISDRWWRTRYGADPTALGSTVFLNGAQFRVVGIAPATFRGSYDALGTDIWVPLMTYNLVRPRGTTITSRGWGWLSATGRLRPGVTAAQAHADLSRIASALVAEHASTNRGFRVNVVQALAIPEDAAPMVRRVLSFALIVVGLALIAACANIANAQLATVASREREIAVRLAVGATRRRILHQWFTESAVLAAAATGAGLLVALWTRDTMLALKPTIPGLQNVSPDLALDTRVLIFAAVLGFAVTVLFGSLPAARAARSRMPSALNEDGITVVGGRRRTWAQSTLVVAQVAVSLALLVSAGLLVRSLRAASAFDLGFDPTNLTIAEAAAGGLEYEVSRMRAFVADTTERIRALPGVRDVTVAAVLPLGLGQESRGVIIDGYTPPEGTTLLSIATNVVGTGYFQAMGIPVVRGRGFQPADGSASAAPVAVVNETMARRYWQDGNPVGRGIRLAADQPPIEVVGVVRDITYYVLGEPPRPYFYVPFGPVVVNSPVFHVRTSGSVEGLAQQLRRELRAFDPRIRVPVVMTYDELRQIALYPSRIIASVSGVFGLLILLLTSFGLYGVVMYAVSQRTREFAVRLALGAAPADLVRGILKQSGRLAVAGLVVGALLATALVHAIRGFLFGVSPFDGLTFGGSAGMLFVIALAAAYLPARKATRIDPATALTGR